MRSALEATSWQQSHFLLRWWSRPWGRGDRGQAGQSAMARPQGLWCRRGGRKQALGSGPGRGLLRFQGSEHEAACLGLTLARSSQSWAPKQAASPSQASAASAVKSDCSPTWCLAHSRCSGKVSIYWLLTLDSLSLCHAVMEPCRFCPFIPISSGPRGLRSHTAQAGRGELGAGEKVPESPRPGGGLRAGRAGQGCSACPVGTNGL